MRRIGRREDLVSMSAHGGRLTEVDDGRREKPERAVLVRVVVPPEEVLPKCARVGDRSESLGKLRTIFERFEVRFGEGIIVRHVRAAMRLGHAEVGQEERDRLALHRGAAVRMKRELPGLNALLRAGLGNEALGERRALVRGEHPADDIAAEDVEDHIEIEVRPLGRAQEFGDVPAPHRVGLRRQQLGRRVVRAPHVIAPFFDFAGRVQQPVHRAR
jgi:hypothetical protein